MTMNVQFALLKKDVEINNEYSVVKTSQEFKEERSVGVQYYDKNDILSENKNIRTAWFEKYENKDWNWSVLSENVSFEFFENYENKPWDWDALSENKNLTLEWFEKYENEPWNWDALSWNENVTLEWIEKYENKPWNWDYLS